MDKLRLNLRIGIWLRKVMFLFKLLFVALYACFATLIVLMFALDIITDEKVANSGVLGLAFLMLFILIFGMMLYVIMSVISSHAILYLGKVWENKKAEEIKNINCDFDFKRFLESLDEPFFGCEIVKKTVKGNYENSKRKLKDQATDRLLEVIA